MPSIYTHTKEDMLKQLIEYLQNVFKDSSYKNHLEAYLSTKSITDTAQLEHYIQQYDFKKANYL